MSEIYLEMGVILALILANGFFALSELSLVSARKSHIKKLAKEGSKAAKVAERLIEHPDRFLAAVQIGITFVGTLASVYGGATIVNYLTPLLKEARLSFISDNSSAFAVGIVVMGISFVSVVIGELAPKYLALAHSEKIAVRVARPLKLVSLLFGYLIPPLAGSAKLILRLVGVKEIKRQSQITETDVQLLMAEGREVGVFDEEEEKLVRSVLDFADITAREAMTPRADIKSFSINASPGKVMEALRTGRHSRYPIHKSTIDKIVGVLFLKDVFKTLRDDDELVIKKLMKPALFVPDSMSISVLLRKMQTQRTHLAICLDEFGGTAGLVTMEDILEEIVGEIRDEDDIEDPEYSPQSEKVVFIAGTLRPDELNRLFDTSLPEEKSNTVAGLIVETVGRIPEMFETVKLNGVLVTVLEREGSRIIRMKIEKIN
ncbi:MAG: HlyC/CorC family transporter [candidate division Zixibacteria bacterium]|nr:HlyC/CorC family transporter [candidate division Zixibacteria bacterium]